MVRKTFLICFGCIKGTCMNLQLIIRYVLSPPAVQAVDSYGIGTAISPKLTVIDDDLAALSRNLYSRLRPYISKTSFNHFIRFKIIWFQLKCIIIELFIATCDIIPIPVSASGIKKSSVDSDFTAIHDDAGTVNLFIGIPHPCQTGN